MMTPKRQPKGTSTGGQFAPDSNPESTVRLEAMPDWAPDVDLQKRTIARCAFRVDEALDVFARIGLYDDDPYIKDQINAMTEARDEILDCARPELAARWRSAESRIRAHERGEGSMTDAGYEELRDVREEAFAEIFHDAFGK